MNPLAKITGIAFIGILVWQVSLTGSGRMMRGCLFQPSPCREGDSAKVLLYFAASGAVLAILTRKGGRS